MDDVVVAGEPLERELGGARATQDEDTGRIVAAGAPSCGDPGDLLG